MSILSFTEHSLHWVIDVFIHDVLVYVVVSVLIGRGAMQDGYMRLNVYMFQCSDSVIRAKYSVPLMVPNTNLKRSLDSVFHNPRQKSGHS